MNTDDFPPAKIALQHLVDLGLLTRGGSTDPAYTQTSRSVWPGFSPFLPTNKPNEAVAIADTTGTMDGRLMKDGQTIDHPGLQLMFRGRDHDAVRGKADRIIDILRKIKNGIVEMEGVRYTIRSFTKTSNLVLVEQEEQNKRWVFSVNYRVTLVKS